MSHDHDHESNLDFVYHSQDDSISCNYKFLTKNMPAKILYKLLESHVEEKRADFEYREFKRDRELFRVSKSTNFEVRLARLMDLVRARYPQFWFERTGRGKFVFCYRGKGFVHTRKEDN